MSKFNRCLWASWLAIVSVGCGATGGGAATDDRGSGGSSAAGEIHAEGAAKPVVVLSPGGKPSAAIDPAMVAIPGVLAVITGMYREDVIVKCLEAGAIECMFKNEAKELFLARMGGLARRHFFITA